MGQKGKIFVHGLRVFAIIGVTEEERKAPCELRIDVEVIADISAVSASDEINDTVDYLSISERVRAYVEKTNFRLLETLAAEIMKMIKKEFGVSDVFVRVAKPHILPQVHAVGVEILS